MTYAAKIASENVAHLLVESARLADDGQGALSCAFREQALLEACRYSLAGHEHADMVVSWAVDFATGGSS